MARHQDSIGGHQQGKAKAGAVTCQRFCPDLPAVSFDNGTANEKPHAHAFFAGDIEDIEQLLMLAGRYAHARVGNAEGQTLVCFTDTKAQVVGLFSHLAVRISSLVMETTDCSAPELKNSWLTQP